MEYQTNTEDHQPLVNPKKFIVWLFIVSIVMVFAALTSAYIVRKGEGNWLEFALPNNFIYSTVVIILSSVALQFSNVFNLKGEKAKALMLLLTTLVLGIAFLFLQYYSWVEIYNYKYPIVFGGSYSNPSGSFLYVLSGVHAFHLITGLIYIIIVAIFMALNKINKENRLHLEMCSLFWHFLGGLWLYLYLFLFLNH